jgi:hypothetical protein
MTFVPGPAVRLVFVAQPTSTYAGLAFAPAVQVAAQDAFGNVASNATTGISLTLAPNAQNVVASGTTTVPLVDGTASFDDLSVTTVGQGYALVATGTSSVPTATSTPFDITYGPPASLSTLSLAPASAPADGVTPITATITILNAGGVPMPGLPVAVTLSGSGGDAFPRQGMTDASGRFVASLTSLVGETKTVTATSGAFVLTAAAPFAAAPCELRLPGPPTNVLDAHVHAIAIGDFDRDGAQDVAMAEDVTVAIMRGVGSGKLRVPYRYPVGGTPTAIASSDVDGDGDLDLVVARADGTLLVLPNEGDGQLGAPIATTLPAPPLAVAVGDLDGDGHLDAAVRTVSSVVVLHGAGDGTFPNQTTYSLGMTYSTPSAVLAIADVTGDGRADLVTVDGTNGGFALVGQAGGAFATPVASNIDGGERIAIADFDGDGHLDLVVSAVGGGAALARGHGDGTFTQSAQFGYYDIALLAADWNDDGKPDLLTIRESHNAYELAVYVGNGDGTFQAPLLYSVGSIVSDFALADLDGDGHLDVVVAEGSASPGSLSTLSVFRGNTAGVQGAPYIGDIPATTSAYFQTVSGDFNGDGKLDLVALNSVSKEWGTQLATGIDQWSAAPTVFSNGGPAVVGDFDRDGKLDVVVPEGGTMNWLAGKGDGTLTAPVVSSVGGYAGAIITADLNHDGIPDLAMTDYLHDSTNVALGNGDGTFATATQYPVATEPQDLVAADVDGDGTLDLVVANRNAVVDILKGVGDGTFDAATTTPVAGMPSSVAAGDFDGDGKIDLVVANESTTAISFLKGNGDTTFQPEATLDVRSAQFAIRATDLDGDGALDIVARAQGIVVLRGRGDGTFLPPARYDDGGHGTAFQTVDLEGDGRTDIMVPGVLGFALMRNTACE